MRIMLHEIEINPDKPKLILSGLLLTLALIILGGMTIDHHKATQQTAQAETPHEQAYKQLATIKVQTEQRRKEIKQAETPAESPTMNLSPTTISEIIRQQLENDIQEIAFKPQDTLDVIMGDKWETLPCTYQDGTFTVTRNNYQVKLKIKIEVIRENPL